jgi:sialate O-acetylesterase
VWGFVKTSDETVTLFFDGKPLRPPVRPDPNGVWRQFLPATATGETHTIKVISSSGVADEITDVLFGDVFLCGGQSNSEF